MIEEHNCFEEFINTAAIGEQQVYGEYKSKLDSFTDESKLPYELLLERKNLVELKISDEEYKKSESALKTPNPTLLQKFQINFYQTIESINQVFKPSSSNQSSSSSSSSNEDDSLQNKKIKVMSWHPQHRLLAVCNKNDVIYIYYFPNQDMYGMGNVRPLTLWFELQSKVYDIQWKPFLPYTLAVACENGIILWEIDISDLKVELKRTSPNYRINQSSTCANILNYPYFLSNTITWSSNGLQLACGSTNHSSILLWDVVSRVPTFIPRYNGNSLLVWSPKNDYLLSCGGKTCRIFDISKWDYNNKEWPMLTNYQTGSWNGKGEYLAVASGDRIQFIQCINRAFESGGELMYVEKTSTYRLQNVGAIGGSGSSSGELFLGGHIKKIAWSPDSQRLAVIFYLNSKSRNNDTYCAIYKIKTYPKFSVTPRGFIRSKDQSIQSVSFVPNYKKGSLLSIAYNDGTIKFFPLLYQYKQ
ncbi:hypothetical protein ACTFIW_004284 [Dictyostelium discoideum]